MKSATISERCRMIVLGRNGGKGSQSRRQIPVTRELNPTHRRPQRLRERMAGLRGLGEDGDLPPRLLRGNIRAHVSPVRLNKIPIGKADPRFLERGVHLGGAMKPLQRFPHLAGFKRIPRMKRLQEEFVGAGTMTRAVVRPRPPPPNPRSPPGKRQNRLGPETGWARLASRTHFGSAP